MDQSLLNNFKDPALARDLLQVIEKLVARIAENRIAEGRTTENRTAENRTAENRTAENRLVESCIAEARTVENRAVENYPQPSSIRIMEVCGTHTVAIARAGFRSVLPASLKLISGPGCPVCVTANVDIDRVIALTRIPGVVVATFGDMIRVPGSSTSLQQRKAQGAAVEVVYSPLDAIKLAEQYAADGGTTGHNAAGGGTHVVFVGVGFETTTPLVAATIERAAARGLANFSVLAVHKRVPPALEALANDAEVAVDALILPGHVSTILGAQPYGFLAEKYHIPGAITGFEPVDILQGIALLLEQIRAREAGEADAAIEIAYKRAVMQEGNPTALAAIDAVFENTDATWRGLGTIEQSGYSIREKYAVYDANRRFAAELSALQEPTVEPRGCRCGTVLRGVIPPSACPLFGRACTPQNPIGPCMVSSEGTCAAYFRYAL
ncbi:MAG: hydrogenase formation protein HypD [Coriobacteriia bacterium]|nr:hydrogenase formation protein HypD [Coriobacteriia bacterium]